MSSFKIIECFCINCIHSTQILESIPSKRVAVMQRRIARVWHRFAYTRGKAVQAAFLHTSSLIRQQSAGQASESEAGSQPSDGVTGGGTRDGDGDGASSSFPPGGLLPRRVAPEQWPHEDDAFGTIMQWLYSRIPETRGGREMKG